MSHNTKTSSNLRSTGSFVMTGAATTFIAAMLIAAGCQSKPTPTMEQAAQTHAPTASGQPASAVCHPVGGQELFASDEDAAKGLLAAIKETAAATRPAPAVAPNFSANKVATGAQVTPGAQYPALCKVLGPLQEDMVSGDPVEDARGFNMFLKHADEHMYIERPTDSKSILRVGTQDWPFPLPIVKAANGKWFFDTAAGKDEILARRIGRNELSTIKTCRVYVLAQREYAGEDRDGSEVLKYAQRFHSTAGKTDGLYWEVGDDEEQSPLGPMFAGASLKGYELETKGALRRTPYQGYYLHILKQQGPDAPGGKYNYVINGNMIAGFALVACPAKYGSSGVMTFIISHQGKLYQKDLGPRTLQAVEEMKEYNPDSSWTLVKD